MTDTDLLRHHELRVTALRLELLRVLRGSDRALSRQDLEDLLKVQADRVTLFRALNAFEEAGLVHRVLDGRGTSCFASSGKKCSDDRSNDSHVHFRCANCGSIFCLSAVELPTVSLPRGFKMTSAHLDVEGTCKKCV